MINYLNCSSKAHVSLFVLLASTLYVYIYIYIYIYTYICIINFAPITAIEDMVSMELPIIDDYSMDGPARFARLYYDHYYVVKVGSRMV